MNFNDERGSAILELLGFGVLLQIPLLVLAFQLTSTQHDQLAAEAIARDSLRSYLLFDRPPEQTAAIDASSYRIPASRISLVMACMPLDCLSAETLVKVSVKVGQAKSTAVMKR